MHFYQSDNSHRFCGSKLKGEAQWKESQHHFGGLVHSGQATLKVCYQSINQSINFVISWCLINATINNYVCTQKIQWENSNQNFTVGIIILHFSQWGRNLISFPPPGKSFGLIFPVGQGSHWVFDTGVCL